jgi:hypothetical protein
VLGNLDLKLAEIDVGKASQDPKYLNRDDSMVGIEIEDNPRANFFRCVMRRPRICCSTSAGVGWAVMRTGTPIHYRLSSKIPLDPFPQREK